MASNVSACMAGSLPSSIPVPFKIIKTRLAATSLFRCYFQYYCKRLAHRNGEFAELDEKYIQRKKFVKALERRLKASSVRYEEVRKERDQLHATHADLVKERDCEQREVSGLPARFIELEFEEAALTIFLRLG